MIQVPEELELIDRNPLRVCELAASFLLDWGVVPTVTLNRSYEARVDEAEVRLGFSLPLALRWLLSHIGSEHPVVGRQDPLVSAENLEVDDDGVIAYRMENQNSARWGFRVDGQANSDPPVVWKRAGRAGRWRAYTDRLSIDLLELTLSESMLISGGNLLHVEGPLDGLGDLEGLLSVDIPSHIFWAIPDGPPVRWYAWRDCIIRDDGGAWYWVFGRTRQAVQSFTALIPAEWEHLAD
ncbi:hypothetical protein J2S43_007978 [Catenuloplanes nepalensis]|uniref:Uncharacterized protein n=1 Tax=Catenuloplanes nepalensis TaxID=587533 RepID=A0ABT9N6Z6_9ACTN|nr:hypothetical protein [Catenuloplanes nepalensis]MDP9799466.1 hypothetical protein [Catenuloplanes nepalensis]